MHPQPPDLATAPDLHQAFERHRGALGGYCYRMLGSPFEADDAVQETLVRAWRTRASFDRGAPVEPWLYRIATNVCIDMLRGRQRRALPVDLAPRASGASTPQGALREDMWVHPVPEAGIVPSEPDTDPAEVAAARESIRLAFVAALQQLPPRQRAVLILRDVLRMSAAETATLLETTVASANSALQRARATLEGVDTAAPGPPLDDGDAELVGRYADAFMRFDVDGLVALLHEDATMTMPPTPMWLRGPDSFRRWWRGDGRACTGSVLLATRANGSAAFATYRPVGPGPDAAGGYAASAVRVVETSGGRVAGIHVFFQPALFDLFGFPRHLDADTPRPGSGSGADGD